MPYSYITHRGWGVPPELAPRDPFTIGAAIVTASASAVGVGVAVGSAAFIAASYIVGSIAIGGKLSGTRE